MTTLTALESNRNRRARLAVLIASNRARSQAVQDGMSALIAAGGLSAIDVASFGFYNGAESTGDASIAAGSAVLSSALGEPLWSADDAGKAIDVAGAGPGSTVLSTTILSYQSPTQVTLSASAATTVAASVTSAAGLAVWGYTSTQAVPVDPLTSADGRTVYEPNPGSPPLSASVVIAAGSTAPRSLAARFADEVSVLDFGADRAGALDCAASIAAAYAALPAAGGSILFPPGRYRINSPLSFSAAKALTLRGAGMFASTVLVNFAAGDGITFIGDNYDDQFEMRDLGMEDIAARNAGTYMLKVDGGVGAARVHACSFNGTRRGMWLRNLSSVLVSDCRGNGLDTALRIENVAYGVITGNTLRTGNGGNVTSYGDGPCIWVGDSTSIKLTGNNFQGAGPRDKIVIRGISSTVSTFTVVLDQATSPFRPGDHLVIRGAGVAAYNGVWRVSSYTDGGFATVTVLSTLNPGAAGAAGTAESITACCYIAADAGSCNESNITGNLFEEMAFRGYGSAALLLDGRRSDSRVQGWTIAGNYYDLGETGIIVHGKPTAAVESTAYGINITGGEFENGTRLILLDQVRGVTINGLNMSAFGLTNTGGDNLLPSGIGSCAVQVIAGSTEPKSRGITIQDCNLGMGREWGYQQWLTYAMDAALVLDGAGIQDVCVTGCQLYGKGSAAIVAANGALATSARWAFRSNRVVAGSGPAWTDAQELPIIASATSIDLPLGVERAVISGVVAIQTVTGLHIGRQVELLFTGASSFITGGNVALAASNVNGQARGLVASATAWHVR